MNKRGCIYGVILLGASIPVHVCDGKLCNLVREPDLPTSIGIDKAGQNITYLASASSGTTVLFVSK